MTTLPHRLPSIVAPVKPLFALRELYLVLLTIEWWPVSLSVRVAAMAHQEVRGDELKCHRLPEPDRTPDVAEGMCTAQIASAIDVIAVSASDDMGTRYSETGRAWGGSGTEHIVTWRFGHDEAARPSVVSVVFEGLSERCVAEVHFPTN